MDWMSGLTPMTRLFVAAGLSSAGVDSVHFIDGSHSSFEFPPSHIESVSDLRGSVVTNPTGGRVGLLRMDEKGYNSQFVISTDQPLSERLVVSASPSFRWGQSEQRSGHTPKDGVECVKYVASVGSLGHGWDDWFPAQDDARALQLALSEFCPIPWLHEDGLGGAREQARRDSREGKVGVGPMAASRGGFEGGVRNLYKGRGTGGIYERRGAVEVVDHYNSQPRKVIIYQRDRNRRLIKTDEVRTLGVVCFVPRYILL